MKIIHEESVYLIPENEKLIVLSGDSKQDLIDCFSNQFIKKKRNYCKVYDQEEQIINNKEMNFIYVPYSSNLESNFQFNPKSLFNTEITNIIEENPKEFLSFETIRNGFYECITDQGMYKLKKILMKNLEGTIDFQISEFNISTLLSMLEIDTSDLSIEKQFAIVYNLLLFLNRDNFNVIYIDFPIREDILEWIESLKKTGVLVLIDNESIQCDITERFDQYAMLILSDQNYMETYNFDIQEFSDISYIQNDFVMLHKAMQTEKNIRLMEQFEDKNTTFYLRFFDTYAQNTL